MTLVKDMGYPIIHLTQLYLLDQLVGFQREVMTGLII